MHKLCSENRFLALLLCPTSVCDLFECFGLLLRCGNMESNSDPKTASQSKQLTELLALLNSLNIRSVRIEEGQSSLLELVNVMKLNQESV